MPAASDFLPEKEIDGIRCLLCSGTRHSVRDALKPAEIATSWAVMGVKLSAAGRACFADCGVIRHLACCTCGFQFFDPAPAGDSAFYGELQRQFSEYYPKTCPAFDRAIEFARRQHLGQVFDLGCGAGFFLDQARAAGLKTGGLDLNATAVADCRAHGHDVQLRSMADFAARNPTDRFRFITAFEVVEHVPDPTAFVKDAANLLQPGGWLGVSVPNNDGVHSLCELEPHQWPPHHLTRWRVADLARLGQQAGLRLEESGADIRHGWHIRFFMDLQGRIEEALGRRPSVPGRWWPETVCLLYRASLMKQWGPHRGLGLYAFYQKPGS